MGNLSRVDRYNLPLMKEWTTIVEARGADLRTWDRRRFWQIVAAAEARVTPQTRMFIDAWLEIAGERRAGRKPAATDTYGTGRLIGEREQTHQTWSFAAR